jgi:excisionase family DNA binding protein
VSYVSRDLLDIETTAEYLSVTARFVRRLVADRRIPFYKVGHFVRFDRADVDAWLEERRVAASAPRRSVAQGCARPGSSYLAHETEQSGPGKAGTDDDGC